MPEPLALTLDAAAKALSVSPRTIRRLLDAGELGRIKIGRAVRVSAASISAYVERNAEHAITADSGILPTCRDARTKIPTGSSVVPIRRTGGRASPTHEAAALAALLARPTERKPKRS